MAKCALVLVLLGSLQTLSLAEDSLSVLKEDKDGVSTHHTLVIDSQWQVAIQYVGAGQNSVVVVMDYKTGVVAFRSFENQACYLVRMDSSFPPLEKLRDTVQSLKVQKEPPKMPPKQYMGVNDPIKDMSSLGAPVQALCRNLPTNYAQEEFGKSLRAKAYS